MNQPASGMDGPTPRPEPTARPADSFTAVRDVYAGRIARFDALADRHAHRSRQLGSARLAVFAAVVVAGLWLERTGSPAAWTAAALGSVAFGGLVAMHRRVRAAEAGCRTLADVNRGGPRRLAREWATLPYATPAPADHPYARDLDILGRASLRQLLGGTATPTGERRLRAWLLEPAPAEQIHGRQSAIRELAGRRALRDAIAAHGLRHDAELTGPNALDEFLAWAELSPWLLHRAGPRLLAWLLLVATWLLIALHAGGVTGALPWLGALGLNYLFTIAYYKRIHTTYDRAFARASVFAGYAPLLATLHAEPYEDPLLRRLARELGTGPHAAHAEFRRLTRLMELSDVRRSAFTYLPVQLFTLWDFHLLAALERWQERAGARARAWIDAAAEIEALAALATLAHDQPKWALPEVADGVPALAARALGHPLLADAARVANDVNVGPPGTFLFITGSNMSGKSTLLRALGVNAVLAQAGAPVCAETLRMPPVVVRTGIRIDDSLAEGVSLFMAELRRVKSIVDAASMLGEAGGPKLLYLLDEIMHGTNTAERRIAARRVLRHLLARGAIGAITTHDLTLADEDDLRAAAVAVHFTETVHGDDAHAPMSFDYRLRPGLAGSTNALRLMALLGLDE